MSRPGPVAQVGLGAVAPFRGFALLIRSPGLWPLAALPCALAAVLLVVLALAAWSGHGILLGWLWPVPEAESGGIWRTLAAIGLAVGLAIAVPLATALLAPAVAEPFLGRLARRVRAIATGEEPTPPSGLYADLVAPLLNQGKKLAFLVGAQVVLLPLLLVPGLGAVAYAAATLVLAWFLLGLTYLEYALETGPRLLAPKERRRYVYRHAGAGLALGAVSSLAALVPCVTFLLLPVAVAGATLLYIDLGGDDGVAD